MHTRKLLLSLALVIFTGILISAGPAAAQEGADETLMLWPDGVQNAKGDTDVDKPTMAVFLPEKSKATGTGVVIYPGGGYVHLAMEKEGYKVARWLNELGVAAFVVKYRLGERYNHPSQINDAQRAIRTVRANASQWGVEKDKIGILGFSAGGHLASTAGTHFDFGDPSAANSIDRQPSRPDFMVLIYPVVTLELDYTHRGSRHHLLGENPDEGLVQYLSNEKQVTDQTPPAFIIHGTNDTAVPVQNSLQLYESLIDHDIPVEMHLFEDGPHGFGLAPDDPELSTWPDLCESWMRSRGLLKD
ncbi:alpha/beta hydrolase [Aliifodinibius sp. S!AR15-10]|uniref:alpha/beta hydrolase n=1 Tax=Aliifodinibius sp. S!AR15-10 TaxID=2950437 RepID=UPI0028667BA7|nr:alpha/beta hydrolase [Aliifodinibius sp. S!AR15-10]MDR8391706.1 alpha/beta hydrolase [Aliifodinibius sp. S!AR15-10]